jgi:aminoglycoside phosphotransferase (APT) family kinase protein
VPDAAASFSSSVVLPVLHEACQLAGFKSNGAKLLRFGENAIYQLADDPVVVRIARSADRLRRVERELCVAWWLAAASVPAVRVVGNIEQPLLVYGYPVSFWQSVTGGDPAPTHADLARLIAAFHSLPDCPCDLARFKPLQTSEGRLTKASDVASDNREFLLDRCADLNDQFQRLEFALPPGPIHGDAHTSNLLTDRGQVVLLDFEAAAVGPREWDLMPTAVARERFQLSEERYRDFASTYGFDVRTWAGYPILREIRELTMTTWLMQNIAESAAAAAEFALRVASLRERDTRRVWTAF